MIEVVAVHTIEGERAEIVLKLPDAFAAALNSNTNDLETSLNYILRTSVNRALTNAVVARKDHLFAEERRKNPVPRDPNAGPNQIAFAGSREPAIEVAR